MWVCAPRDTTCRAGLGPILGLFGIISNREWKVLSTCAHDVVARRVKTQSSREGAKYASNLAVVAARRALDTVKSLDEITTH